jgi:hypothetical protein
VDAALHISREKKCPVWHLPQPRRTINPTMGVHTEVWGLILESQDGLVSQAIKMVCGVLPALEGSCRDEEMSSNSLCRGFPHGCCLLSRSGLEDPFAQAIMTMHPVGDAVENKVKTLWVRTNYGGCASARLAGGW